MTDNRPTLLNIILSTQRVLCTRPGAVPAHNQRPLQQLEGFALGVHHGSTQLV